MNANEHDDSATPRASGDVLTKSASQSAGGGAADEKTSQDADSGTRAGGDVIIKGASQKQTTDSK